MSAPSPVDPADPRTRILVVDDHELIGEGLRMALEVSGFDVVLSACATAAGILEEASVTRPSLVLLDLQLGEAGEGRDLIRPLIGLGAAVLVLTGLVDRVELARCLEAGAVGVASKAESFSSVLEKIRQAAEGGNVTPAGDRAMYMNELRDHRMAERAKTAPFATLTRREKEVLTMIVDGSSAQTIARDSFVSMATIRTQIRSILQKLGVNSQLAAAAMARTSGWKSDA